MGKPAWRSATTAALILLLCVFIAWPFAETGMHDDGYYIVMARTFARTGHVAYNGWGAPLLGIQLLLGALSIKLFGFSFTVARFTTVIAALITTALLVPTMTLCGLSRRNAWICAVTLMTSPVALPVVPSFVTDIWSLLAIVLCLYACLRALLSSSETKMAAWIVVAALGNTVLGTCRQIAWLGVLVLVPSTLFLLRKNHRKTQLAGWASVLAGVGIIAVCLRWLARQPYTLPETLIFHGIRGVPGHPTLVTRPALELLMLTIPVLVMFVPAVSLKSRQERVTAAVVLLVTGSAMWHLHVLNQLQAWRAPFSLVSGSVFGPKGVYHEWPVWGIRPSLLPDWCLSLIALATVAGTAAWIITLSGERTEPLPTPASGAASPLQVATLLLPFTAAYVLALTPRAIRDLTLDRYLIPLVMVALIGLVLWYQRRVAPELPAMSGALCLLIAAYSAVTLQDAFGMYRAVIQAGEELRAHGVPRSQFDGGGEFDGLTQVQEGGYVHQNFIRMPRGQELLFGHRRTGPCEISFDVWIPDVNPAYTLAYTPDGCGGSTPLAPVSYRRLIWPHTVTIYIVRDPDLSGKHGLFASF